MFVRCSNDRTGKGRLEKRLIAALCASVVAAAAPLGAQSIDVSPYPLQTRQSRPIEFQKRAPGLEELIQRSDMPFQILQPIPLQGVRITGLYPKTVDILGFNYFVVVNNTKYRRLSDIYRDNRLKGKSNFVTADSIIHPYTAFTNRVLADAAVKQLTPDLLLLLKGMLKVSLSDCEEAEDADIREDIERNIAYLSVALKLLNPGFQIPEIGNVQRLVDLDLKCIFSGKILQSAIFDREEDFSAYKPQGWYATSGDLEGFYRCRQWLSRMAYPIIDVSEGTEGNKANSFRRSVLLFRSLDMSEALGRPASELWSRLLRGLVIFGTPLESWRERTLYPQDYKLVFKTSPGSLKVTLRALAEPLYRTKLMLAIRRQKPMNLGSASIFELDDSLGPVEAAANFRLFPLIGEPESPWLRSAARFISPERQGIASWPIALLDTYAWGGQQAGNILADNIRQLDPALSQALPELQHCVLRRLPGGQTQPVESRRWQILGSLLHQAPEGVPGALRTELWMTRKVESAFAAWVDGLASIAPPVSAEGMDNAVAVAESPPPQSSQTSASGSNPAAALCSSEDQLQLRRSKIPPFHYLEPNPELFRKLTSDAQKLMSDLCATGYFQESYRSRFLDFIRLFQRLEKIADTEIRGQPLNGLDKKLLGNIDLVLDKVDVPLAATIAFDAAPAGSDSGTRSSGAGAEGKEASNSAKNAPSLQEARSGGRQDVLKAGKDEQKTTWLSSGHTASRGSDSQFGGFNLALGNPGMLFIIFQNPRTLEWTLGRGALYTYYEMPAPLLSDVMWQHKLEAGFFKPPTWSQKFDIVQTASPVRTPSGPAVKDTH